MDKKTLLKDRLEEQEVQKFLTFPNEHLILAVREHAIPLIIRLIQKGVAFFALGAFLAGLIFFALGSIPLGLASLLCVLLIGTGLIIQETVHWYFHFYIITTKKILEVCYSPLFSELTNSVLLDQIRCTEIDAELHGVISEFLDLGDVTITFDRPTHQAAFTLSGIRSPRKVANYLTSRLHGNQNQNIPYVWYKKPDTNRYLFTDEIQYPYQQN